MRRLRLRRPSASLVLAALALIVAVAGNSGPPAGTKVIVRGSDRKRRGHREDPSHRRVHPKALSGGAVTTSAIGGCGRIGGVGPTR
jgi:hypothetical protein